MAKAHQTDVRKLLAAAQSLLDALKEGGADRTHPLRIGAQDLVEYHKAQVQNSNPFGKALNGSTLRPKMRPVAKQPERSTTIPVGTTVYGEIKTDWHEKGYVFISVVGVVEEDGSLTEVANHTDVFLHRNGVPDLEEREVLAKGDTVVFLVEEGTQPGKLAAAEVRGAVILTEDETGADDAQSSVEADAVTATDTVTEAEAVTEETVH